MSSTEKKRRRRANGEGSIYQRASDGKWVGTAYVFTTKGVRKRGPVYGNSFDEVREKLDKLKGNSANGIASPDRTMTVAEYLEHWLAQIKDTKRITTWRGYESAVRLHIVPVLGKRRIEKLTGADVRQLVAACRVKCLCCINRYDQHRPEEKRCCSAGKCCARTPSKRQIQFIHAVLRNALSSAERDELVTRNVAKLVQIPTPRYRVGKGLQVADVTTLLAEAKKTRLYAHRDRQQQERADMGEIWQEHGLVFPTGVGTPMEPRSLNRHFHGIRTRAGLPSVRLHDFRH